MTSSFQSNTAINDGSAEGQIYGRQQEQRVQDLSTSSDASIRQADQVDATNAAAEAAKPKKTTDAIEKTAKENTNPLQEVGTALLGGAIDGAQGVINTVEQTAKLKMFDNEFEPTWAWTDEQEPMNKTQWGNALRAFAEFTTLALVTRRAAKGIGATRIPVVAPAAAWVGGNATTLPGAVARGAAAGAVVDFVNSYAQGETVSTELEKVFPWLPLDFLVTNPDDSPLWRRLKNVGEGAGMGALMDTAGWFLRARFAKKGKGTEAVTTKADEPAVRGTYRNAGQGTKESTGPTLVEALTKGETNREAAKTEVIKGRLEADPLGQKGPDPYINPGVYNTPDSAVFSKGTVYDRILQTILDARKGIDVRARKVAIMTEAGFDRVAKGKRTALQKVIKEITKEIETSENLGMKIGDQFVSPKEISELAAARYVDLVDAAASGETAQALAEKLLENAAVRKNVVTGKESKVLNIVDFKAAEMLTSQTAGEIADLALASKTFDKTIDNSELLKRLNNRLETFLMLTGEAKYYRGLDLQQLQGGKNNPFLNKVNANYLAEKDAAIKQFMADLEMIQAKDPELTSAFINAFAKTNGDVRTLDQLMDFARSEMFNLKSVVGVEGKRSMFVEAMNTTLYNSILGAPKTLVRAALGTNLVAFMRPVQLAIGGFTEGDSKMMQLGMHQVHSFFQGMGEAWNLAKVARENMVKGAWEDVPYYNQNIIPATETQGWKELEAVVEGGGNFADKASFRMINTLLNYNNLQIVRYPAIGLGMVDSFTKTLMGRMELRSKAFEAAWNKGSGVVDSKVVAEYEATLRDQIFNKQGEVISEFGKMQGNEAALMIPLSGTLGSFEKLINSVPVLRPFFLFMKTGANGLSLAMKHTPLLARFNDQVRGVLSATPDDLSGVLKFGITTAEELMEQKSVIKGRIATGYLTVAAAGGLYVSGGLTGNGPENQQQRALWRQAGWQPRSIKVGDTWVSYQALEPFASLLAVVADIGDNQENLGESWAERSFEKLGYLIAMNMTNKSFVSGLGPLNDILTMKEGANAVWLGGMINNFIPHAGLRRELGNVFNPGMREVEKDIMDTILSKNPGTRAMLPMKVDVLDGSTLQEWDMPTRILNTISPFQLSKKDTETRRTLRESGYDAVHLLSTSSRGVRLSKDERSLMQTLMGKQGIEEKLTKLFASPQAQAELKTIRALRDAGVHGRQPDKNGDVVPIKSFALYSAIDQIFTDAKKAADAEMRDKFPDLDSRADRAAVLKDSAGSTDINKITDLLSTPR